MVDYISSWIKLEPLDPHWIKLYDPAGCKCTTDIGDWWENNFIGKGERPTIDIRIPEIIGNKGKVKIRWYSNDWHGIGLSKSKDGIEFIGIWSRAAHYTFDETHEIELDPEYEFYRIYFSDGDLSFEVTRVHKDIELLLMIYPTPVLNMTIDIK